jgi:hypothetical protein
MKVLLQMRKLDIMALMRAYEEKWIWKKSLPQIINKVTFKDIQKII